MTLQEFKANIDWQMTFDVAFGIAVARDKKPPADTSYVGPIMAVTEVYACNRMADYRGYAWAAVRFEGVDAPSQYAVVWSAWENGDPCGDVTWFPGPFSQAKE